jgi:adenylate kinase
MRNKQAGDAEHSKKPEPHTSPRILITGVPGAGKTSIAAGIIESIPEAATCEFGRLMAEIGRKQKLFSHYHDLQDLPRAVRAELQIAAARDVSRLNQPVAVAAHVVVRAPEGYVEGLPEQALSYLGLTGIIVITSDPQAIRNRRIARGSDRAPEDIELIRFHQESVERRALEIARTYEIPIEYIVNVDGEMPEVVGAAIQLWKSFDIHQRLVYPYLFSSSNWRDRTMICRDHHIASDGGTSARRSEAPSWFSLVAQCSPMAQEFVGYKTRLCRVRYSLVLRLCCNGIGVIIRPPRASLGMNDETH